ncbi:hypothetical protein CspHIS471_0607390 [Cutaneotrichosporon sp. HIS471]|nr:hypothetical protein CspHIS471_0607390 [Cutaneotrichosporon sp. HIS471]
MNTPPPETTKAQLASEQANSDDEVATTPPPITPTAPPPRDAVHCACGAHDQPPLAVLLRTIDFAAWAVANILSSCGVNDIHLLQAALLHDTVEDTHTTIKEIEEAFGSPVANIVAECTDDVSLNGLERKAEQLRTAPFRSREAQQVKLADKLHNLESIRRSPPVGWGVRRIQSYFMWAKQVTDVCAPANPELSQRLMTLYKTAYTHVDGQYFPCHPEMCGPLTEEEKGRVDSRFATCKSGEEPCPRTLFF